MKLIKQITDVDILVEGENALVKEVSRYGSRGVVMDDKSNLALLHMTT
ncbi:hypothetical protein J2Z69_001126 [Paenibacillus shirakamiensis]|uniref:Uncharacterized protein n=1 Tax=Paenibacillus shirakamiensis TaxID=1265935 RepID=A0ABS4JEI1_9BACL|nr:hypothetical protein [Paenibacillus shirakamiensis]MBP2000107.1 hypothetical protein [Paenibacillus shirakamiensis]